MKKKVLSSLFFLASGFSLNANANIYNQQFNNIAPELTSTTNGLGISLVKFDFTINFGGMSTEQFNQIISAVDNIGSIISSVERSELNTNLNLASNALANYADHISILGNTGDHLIDSVQNAVNNFLLDNAFDPDNEATDHRTLTGHFAAAVGFKVSLLQELIKREDNTPDYLKESVDNLYTELSYRGSQTDSYIESNIIISSQTTYNCDTIAPCKNYTVINNFTGESFVYTNIEWAFLADNKAAAKRNAEVINYQSILKGSNFTTTLNNLYTLMQ